MGTESSEGLMGLSPLRLEALDRVSQAHVFMYHGIPGESEGAHLHKRSYDVPAEVFTRHVRALKTRIGQAPSTNLGLAPLSSRWAMTFDDGAESALHAATILESVGWRAYFFVVSSWIGRQGFLDASQIVGLQERGHVVGSHSLTHPDPMSGLPYAQLVREWRESLETLSEILGMRISTAAVPGGGYSREVAAAASEAGVEVLFTSEPTSRIRLMEGCTIIGRYAMRAFTDASAVVDLALGDTRARGGQWLAWNSRKLAKKALGKSYYSLRTRLLDSGHESRS